MDDVTKAVNSVYKINKEDLAGFSIRGHKLRNGSYRLGNGKTYFKLPTEITLLGGTYTLIDINLLSPPDINGAIFFNAEYV